MKYTHTLSAIAMLLLCSSVPSFGHTYFDSIIINNQNHRECMRPSRPWEKENPIGKVTDNDMKCGFLPWADQPAQSKCSIKAGSSLSLQWWHTQPGDDVVADTHKGPCLVYLAKSDTGNGNVWFKIFESGLDVASQTWCVDTLIANRGRLDIKLPANLTSGNYLLRGEIFALHNGYAIDGVQPYVGCAELSITDGGSEFPSSDKLVAFPGYYRNTDPGFYPVSMYNGPIRSYVIPGPPVWGKFSTGSDSSSATATSGSGSVTPTPGGGGSSIPTASSAATCAAVSVSTKLRAGASWGNPPHNVYDISVTNNGNKDITDLVLKITLDTGAVKIDEVWNMAKRGDVYWVSEPIKAGKTYTGAGYIIFSGSATVEKVCGAAPSYDGEYGSSSTTGYPTPTPTPTTGYPTPTPTPTPTTGYPTPTPSPTTGSPVPTPTPTTGSPTPTPTPTTGSPTPIPSTTGSASSDDTNCRAGVSFTLSQSWNGGGMVNIVISNTGTKVIKKVEVTVNVDNNYWNLVGSAGSRVYTLPDWGLPLAVGARFDAAGYTFSGSQPASGSIKASC